MWDISRWARQDRVKNKRQESTVTLSVRLGAVLSLALLVASSGCGGAATENVDARNYFLEAREALQQGDTNKAIAAFTASIESKPNAWAYMERAKLYAAAGQGDQALQDAQKAVELEPDNSDTRWLEAEMKKPANQRFKGIFELPPSARK